MPSVRVATGFMRNEERLRAKRLQAANASLREFAAAAAELRPLLEELVQESGRVVDKLEVGNGREFAYLGAVFVARQREHALAVRLLGSHPDAAMIARTMVEGFWQLKWVLQDPVVRATRWRDFVVVQDWRTMKSMEASGQCVEKKDRQRVQADILAFGTQFLRKRYRNHLIDDAVNEADPFERNWFTLRIVDLAEAVGQTSYYETKYRELSEHLHWGFSSLAHSLHASHQSVRYRGGSGYTELLAHLSAIQCLADCAMLVDEHLGLGRCDRIRSLVHESVVKSIKGGVFSEVPE
jgi:hypothetical protein